MERVKQFKRYDNPLDQKQFEEIKQRIEEVQKTLISLQKNNEIRLNSHEEKIKTIGSIASSVSSVNHGKNIQIISDLGTYAKLSDINFGRNSYLQGHQVTGETIGTGDGTTKSFTHTCSNYPLFETRIKINCTISGTAIQYSDNGYGKIYSTDGITLIGTVDYTTGVIDLNFSIAPDASSAITADYEYFGDEDVIVGNLSGKMEFKKNYYVPYTGATQNVDLGGYDLSLTDLHVNGIFYVDTTEIQVTNYNKYIPLITNGNDIILIYQTAYWDGVNYTATRCYGYGKYALQYNKGSYCTAIGDAALKYNLKSYCDGIGYATMAYNTGTHCVGMGYLAMYNNAGDYCVGIGDQAARDNEEKYCVGIGSGALRYNKGEFNFGIGESALYYATRPYITGVGRSSAYYCNGSNCTAIGANSLTYCNWNQVVGIGSYAVSQFNPNPATDKSFAYADIDPSAHTITFSSNHNFGSTGFYVNLLFTNLTGTPPSGLADGNVYQFKIVSSTVLEYDKMTSQGSTDFTGKLTKDYDLSYSIGIGYMSQPTKAKQIMLGNPSYTDEIVLNGNAVLKNITCLGYLENTADPTTTDIPADKDFAIFKNTSSGAVYLAYNDGGTIKKAQLT